MSTKISIANEQGRLKVMVSDEDGYCLWRGACKTDNRVYFEWDGPKNNGYNHVTQIMVMYDGMHIVLKDDQLVHFYFNKLPLEKYRQLVMALRSIYPSPSSKILEILDS